MTSQHSQQNLFNTTSYQEDSPAKTSQLQGDRKASRRLQGLVSSTNSSRSYAWYDQNTSSWRTYQRSLITEWELFSQSFTRQGYMNANGQLFQLALLELPIKETDGGLLPTPLASDPDRKAKFKQGGTPLRAVIDQEMLPTPTREAAHHRNNVPPSIGKTRGYDLTMKICEMLPTPTTMDHLGQRSPEALKKQMEGARKGRTSLSNLREAVNPETQETFNSLLPTPRAAQGMNMRLSENMAKLKHKKYLETEIAAEIHENLPTPSAREWKNGSADSTKNCKKQDQLGRKIHHLTEDQLPTPTASEHKARMKDTTQDGKCLSAMARQDKLSVQNGGDMFLNPAFVEEMMGYEVGWTELKL